MRTILHNTAEEKRKEILEYLSGMLNNEIDPELLDLQLDTICSITPQVYEDELFGPEDKQRGQVRLHTDSGIEGGFSVKPGNIRINFKKVLDTVAETGLSVFEALEHPWLLLVVGLLTTKKALNLAKIKIEERHAMVIASLWKLRNAVDLRVPRKGLAERINEIFKQLNKNLLTDMELDSILSDLDDMKCIRLNSDGTVSLIEEVIVTY